MRGSRGLGTLWPPEGSPVSSLLSDAQPTAPVDSWGSDVPQGMGAAPAVLLEALMFTVSGDGPLNTLGTKGHHFLQLTFPEDAGTAPDRGQKQALGRHRAPDLPGPQHCLVQEGLEQLWGAPLREEVRG